MKRAFVFLMLGPMTVALVGLFATAAIGGPGGAAHFVGIALFILTLPVAAVAGAVDGLMADGLPVAARASVTATIGAVTASVLVSTLIHWIMPNASMMPVALGGAVSMGLCSLLSHDYGSQRAPAPRAQGLSQPADR